MNLLDQIAADTRRPDVLRGVIASVTAVGTGTVTVEVLGGAVPDVPVARSYASPTIGDVVLVLKIGAGPTAAWLALTALG